MTRARRQTKYTNKVFVDASVWIALALIEDAHHGRAVRVTRELMEEGAKLVTSDYVLDEAATRIKRKDGGATAVRFLSEMVKSRVEVVYMNESLYEVSRIVFARHKAAKTISFTDASILAVMAGRRVGRLLTFDADLEVLV